MTIRIEAGLLWGVRLGVVLILLTPLVVTESTLFPFVVGKAVYFRSLTEIVFALWLVLALRNRSYRVAGSWIVALFAVYVVVSLASAAVGVSFQKSFWGDYRRMGGVFDLAHWLAFLVVLASVWRSRSEWRWLLNANLGVSLAIGLLGLAQHYDVRVFQQLFWYFQPTDRLDITFGNATYVAAYTLVNGVLALGFLALSFSRAHPPEQIRPRRGRNRGITSRERVGRYMPAWRAYWIFAALLNFWVLSLSGTRGAIAGLLVGLMAAGVVYAIWGNRRRLRIWAGGLTWVIVILVLLVPLLRDTGVFRPLARSNVLISRVDSALDLGMDDPSVSSRLSTMSTGLEAFTQAPLLGWGPENFAVAFDRHAGADDALTGGRADQAHNKPIEELTTRGLLGFVVYSALIGSVLWLLLRVVRRRGQEQMLAVFIGAGLIGYLIQSLFLFDTPGTFLQFMLLVGWVAARDSRRFEGNDPVPAGHATGSVGPAIRRSDARAGRVPAGAGAAEPWLPSLPSWLNVPEASVPRLINSVSVMIGVALVVALFSVTLWRPYHAARLFPVQAASLEQFLENAQVSFSAFPPLATLGRQFLFDTLSENWEQAGGLSDLELLDRLEAEGEAALRSEPQNVRLYLSLARLYQQAAISEPAFLILSESYVEKAQELAPELIETVEVALLQKAAEDGYAEGLTAVYEYFRLNPDKKPLLSPLMNDMQNRLIAEIGGEEYVCRRWGGKLDLSLEQRAEIECQ